MPNQSTKPADPTPEEIEEMKAELKAEHMRKTRDEPEPWTPPRVRGTVEEPGRVKR